MNDLKKIVIISIGCLLPYLFGAVSLAETPRCRQLLDVTSYVKTPITMQNMDTGNEETTAGCTSNPKNSWLKLPAASENQPSRGQLLFGNDQLEQKVSINLDLCRFGPPSKGGIIAGSIEFHEKNGKVCIKTNSPLVFHGCGAYFSQC